MADLAFGIVEVRVFPPLAIGGTRFTLGAILSVLDRSHVRGCLRSLKADCTRTEREITFEVLATSGWGTKLEDCAKTLFDELAFEEVDAILTYYAVADRQQRITPKHVENVAAGE